MDDKIGAGAAGGSSSAPEQQPGQHYHAGGSADAAIVAGPVEAAGNSGAAGGSIVSSWKRGNQMKKAFIFLLFCAGCADAQFIRETFIRGPFFDVIRGEAWTSPHYFRIRNYTPAERICLTVFNHNATSAHTFAGGAEGTADSNLIGIASVWKSIQLRGSGNVSFDGNAAITNRLLGTIAPISMAQVEIDMRGIAVAGWYFSTDGLQPGVNDTFTITGATGSCGFREGGRMASLFSADPAANTEIAVTVPAYATWRVMGATATLVTSAAVANRLVTLIVDDGANELFRVNAAVTQAASLTYSYSFASAVSDTVVPGNVVKLPQLIIKSGYRIRTLTTNLQAGDDWSAMRLLVEEWVQ